MKGGGERLKEAIDFSMLSVLQPSNIAEQKKKFLDGEVDNPEFEYAFEGKVDVDSCEQKLLDLKKDLLEGEENEIIKTLYRQRINEGLASLRMIRAMKDNDDRRFYRYSRFIYGEQAEQEEELAREEFFFKIVEISKGVVSEQAKAEFDRILGNEYFKGLSRGKIESEKKETGPVVELGNEELVELFEQVLCEYGWEKTWDIKIVPNLVAIRVRKFGVDKPVIEIPEDRERKFSLDKIRKLIAHEIETHVLRGESGKKSKLKLLELGLDRYLATEEGLSVYNEQIIDSDMRPERAGGLWGAVSLAISRQHNFRETFDILKDLYLAAELKNTFDIEKARLRAGSLAWNRAMRVFRGISDVSKAGNRYTKDIVYREGNIGVWEVAKNNPEEIVRFSIGKYDPANHRHIWILDQLGISETDLEKLKK